MTPHFAPLTDHQVRTQFSILSFPEEWALVLLPAALEEFTRQRQAAEAQGGSLDIYYWPNNIMIFIELPNSEEPPHVEDLVRGYYEVQR